MFVFGIAVFFLNYLMRTSSGSYYPMLALIAPVLIAGGVVAVIEAPPMPIEKLSFFGWICLITGGAFGIWNAFF